jgi:hypothetical protein
LADSLLGVVAEAGADALEEAVKEAHVFDTLYLPRAAVLASPGAAAAAYPVWVTSSPGTQAPVLAVAVWEHER